MPFLQLTLHIGPADPAPYEGALFDLGALSVTLADAADDPILEPAPGATPLWPTVIVQALFDAQFQSSAILEGLRGLVGAPLPASSFESIADRDWEREWLKDFRPMRFGQRLWVCPAGQRPLDEHAIAVDLDPGLAFGTGTHATTALCLEWLDAAMLRNRKVIDYGCGSGILAIAALKLGAEAAYATDIDAQALLASRDNALRNRVADRLHVVADPSTLVPVDILMANILAAPLHELAPVLAKLVVPNGSIVLSGLLDHQAAEMTERYRTWFDMSPAVIKDGWARLTGVRSRSEEISC
jgi:ribosomal protein L11 methyltransferase